MSGPAAIPVAIIDDNESFACSLSRLLRVSGFDAKIYLSAEEFLAAAERRSLRCLLVDIQLGGISGIALHRQLLAKGDCTPVIYITAHEEPSTRAEAMSTGPAGFFIKADAGSAIIAALCGVTGFPNP